MKQSSSLKPHDAKLLYLALLCGKLQVGKDQEKAQLEPSWEKTKLKIRHLYHENIS